MKDFIEIIGEIFMCNEEGKANATKNYLNN